MPRGPRPSSSTPDSEPGTDARQPSHDAIDAPVDGESPPRRVVVGAAWSLPVLRGIAETDGATGDAPDDGESPRG